MIYINDMITHSVYFRLKHAEDSPEEKAFLEKADALKSISTVRNLQCVREISPKNNYRFGLTMQFEDRDAYRHYNDHPDHQAFVEQVWIPEVAEFLEIDYEPIRGRHE